MEGIELSCSTIIHRELDLFRALELISQDGFKRIDLCIIPGVCLHVDPENSNPSDENYLREYLAQQELSISSLNVVPGHFNSPSAERSVSFTKCCIDLASQLNTGIVSLPSGQLVERDKWEHAVVHVADCLKKLADYAEQQEVQISVEAPHLRTLTETVEQAVKFFELVSDERVKCTFDTSHVFRGERISLLEGLGRIGIERINHIHLRDVIGDDISVTPGRGHIDFPAFLRQLQHRGYTGHVSLELEFHDLKQGKKRAELRFAKRYVENLLLQPDLPLGLKLRTSGLFKFLERFRLSPKQELKRYPWLFDPLRKLKSHLISFKPVLVYDGYWRKKWYIPNHRRFVIQKANSVSLAASPTGTIRVCIQGCGGSGAYHAFGYKRLAGIEVAGVCDIDTSKTDTLAPKLGCNSYSSLAEMVEAESPDVVSVCTREWQHYESVIRLLKAGVDVFCEKIMATRYSHAQEMVDLAKERGRVLAVNYNYRFIPGIRKLKEIIENHALGNLQLLNINVHAFSYHHALDLVSFLAGDIVSICASYTRDDAVRDFGGTDWSLYDSDILYVPSRNLAAIFRLKSGARATITSSYFFKSSEFILNIEAVFDSGAVALSGINTLDVVGSLTFTSNRPVRKDAMNHRGDVFAPGYEYCFYRSIESFMNAYVRHEPPETSGRQALFNICLEKAVGKANTAGLEVYLNDVCPQNY